MRVLVVDDNQTNRLILGEQLGAWGMDVDLVEDGPAALAAAADAAADAGAPYALALLDLLMPGMDGIEVARKITTDPVLAGTGSDPADVRLGGPAGGRAAGPASPPG